MKIKAQLPKVWLEFIDAEAHRTNCSKSVFIDKLIRKSIALHGRQAEWILKGDQFKVRICEEIKLSSVDLELRESGAFFITLKQNKDYEGLEKELKKLSSLRDGSEGAAKMSVFVALDIFDYLDTQRKELGLSLTFLITNAIQVALALDAAYDTQTIGERTFKVLEEIENTVINFIKKDGQLQIGMRLLVNQQKINLIREDRGMPPVFWKTRGQGSQRPTRLLRRGYYDN